MATKTRQPGGGSLSEWCPACGRHHVADPALTTAHVIYQAADDEAAETRRTLDPPCRECAEAVGRLAVRVTRWRHRRFREQIRSLCMDMAA